MQFALHPTQVLASYGRIDFEGSGAGDAFTGSRAGIRSRWRGEEKKRGGGGSDENKERKKKVDEALKRMDKKEKEGKES